ncbi:hypothetical protein [Maricaulis salignorans]|uniref:hypothetical protein n=1 Tax=Maricaulis salignorans TaxID=144026 RepID=UPI003A8F4E3C
MRAFLTYVLAALAAGSVFHLVPVLALLGRGEPVPEGGFVVLLMTLLINSLVLVVVGSAIWTASGALLSMIDFSRFPFLNIARGAVVFAVVGVSAVLVGSIVYGSQDQAGAMMIAAFFAAEALPLTGALCAIMGAAWGTVFWLRAPKPQTTGAAA